MKLAEEEAKKKWCPHVRKFYANGSDQWFRVWLRISYWIRHFIQSKQGDGYSLNCIASECTSWRWYEMPYRKHKRADGKLELGCSLAETVEEAGVPPEGCENWEFKPASYGATCGAIWLEPEALAGSRRKGYCGLAGRPE